MNKTQQLQRTKKVVNELLNASYVSFKEGTFFIEEMVDSGKGRSFFHSTAPVLLMKSNHQGPLIWALDNKKCAEGGFIVFNDDGLTLHLLEMKSQLRRRDWSRVKEQLMGMYLASIAIMHILQLERPISVTAYVAYTEDKTQQRDNRSYIYNKTINPAQNIELQEWSQGKLYLPHGIVAEIRKGLRKSTGDIDFGWVN